MTEPRTQAGRDWLALDLFYTAGLDNEDFRPIILAIEAEAATPPALDASDWRELFTRCGQKWAALLERYDLAEDATPEDIIRVAERRGAWDALARQGLRPPRPPKPSANRQWDGS